MTETGFKFSRFGAEGEGHQEADIVQPDPSTNSMTMMLGDGSGAMGSAKAVRRTTLLLMALVGVICLLSVVVSALALSRVMSLEPTSEKIWTFALGQSHSVLHYIDGKSLEMDGFDVDMVRSVCSVAGKECEIVTDEYTNCWTSQKGSSARGGEGLNAGWYDACAGWSQTPERRRAFAFTEPYTKTFPSVFYLLNNRTGSSPFDLSNLEGKKIGFLDGYSNDEHCLNRQLNIEGLPLDDDQIFHYPTIQDAEAALRSNEIDALYSSKASSVSLSRSSPVEGRSFNCSTRGLSVMTRKDSGLRDWWNPAWEEIYSSKSYHVICQTLEIRHGRFPGLHAEDICLPPQ